MAEASPRLQPMPLGHGGGYRSPRHAVRSPRPTHPSASPPYASPSPSGVRRRVAAPGSDRQAQYPSGKAAAGFLRKRHQTALFFRKQWATRYVRIDRTQGTIVYSKGPKQKASTCLPLSDCRVTRISDLEFRISCPYLPTSQGLTLSAESAAQCARWVRCIAAVASWQRGEPPPLDEELGVLRL